MNLGILCQFYIKLGLDMRGNEQISGKKKENVGDILCFKDNWQTTRNNFESKYLWPNDRKDILHWFT